jgi:hypothetical protein
MERDLKINAYRILVMKPATKRLFEKSRWK